MSTSHFQNFKLILALLHTACLACMNSTIAVAADEVWTPPIITDEMRQAKRNVQSMSDRIDNSSIVVSKQDLDEFKKSGKLPMWITITGEIKRSDISIITAILAPYLDKNYLKKHPAPSWYKSSPDEIGFMVFLDSEGGDMFAALEIGRLFRKARVHAFVNPQDKCLSACVFLLAGAVKRSNSGPVGIHRPYLSDIKPTSFENMQQISTKLEESVRLYLKQMNIPDSLYERMRQIPPENVKILSYSELDRYGLNDIDPVFAELNDNSDASFAKLSKSEYLARKAESNRCKMDGFARLERKKGTGDVDMLEFAKMQRECEKNTIYRDKK